MRSPTADARPRPANDPSDPPFDASKPAPSAPRSPLAAWATAYAAIVLLVFVEIAAWSAAHAARFVGFFEVTRALTSLGAIAFVLAAPLAAVGLVIAELAQRAERSGERPAAPGAEKRRWAARAALFAIGVFFGAAVGWGVSGGRRLEGLRPLFSAGIGLASGVAIVVVASVFAKLARRSPRAAIASIAVACAAAEIANALVWPRLYPAFHLGLSVLAAAVAASAAFVPPRALTLSRARIAAGIAAIATLAGLGLAVPAAQRIAPSDNLRVVFLGAPAAGRLVEIAARLAPPPPIDPDPATAAILATERRDRLLDLSGRDILLVTIDALRADHVGAYGYDRPTTPTLDRLANEGVLFEAAYTPAPHTSYAITSLMTGKPMRPLVLQGLGADSETWADHLRRYGYRTAAFYPPAVFFIDAEKLAPFRDRFLGFEYRRVEFLAASGRADQVRAYLDRVPPDQRVFLWVHLFEPHEPYEAHEAHPFGERDIDRYDAEIAAADAGLAQILETVRGARPSVVTLVTADHGEEFGEHGGRYHGTSVYEEQVRVPLVIHAPELVSPRRVARPVSLVDLLPTVLNGLAIPRPARLRGDDISPWILGKNVDPNDRGHALSETDEQTLLAEGTLRLVCARRIGACVLHDLTTDPGELRDAAAMFPSDAARLRQALTQLAASHGTFEVSGLRAEGKSWPPALRRGLAGDVEAAPDVAALLDDADVVIRRKAAEVLFDLRSDATKAGLRLSVQRDEDETVRRWASLALTRLGEGAGRTVELLSEPADPSGAPQSQAPWARLAALALAEQGQDRGEEILVAWARAAFRREDPEPLPFHRGRELVLALGRIRSKDALLPLLHALRDVRLRPYVAEALADIDEDAARPAMIEELDAERTLTGRTALVAALVRLGAKEDLAAPLARALGRPDPLPNGLGFALKAGILAHVGGPRSSDLARLVRLASSGVPVRMVVPRVKDKSVGSRSEASKTDRGIRAICRASTIDGARGEIRVGRITSYVGVKGRYSGPIPSALPELDPKTAVVLPVVPGADPRAAMEVFATMPPEVALRAGDFGEILVIASANVRVEACAIVALLPELPPPPPEPWTPASVEDGPPGAPGSQLPPPPEAPPRHR